MRLSELSAEFVDAAPNGGIRHGPGCGQGVLFEEPNGKGGMLCVWFANPIGGKPPAGPEHLPAPRWQRTGETIEALTLTPSVNAVGGWHGWVRDGEAVTC